MEVTITIKIKTENPAFDKNELISDIKYQFVDITGHEIEEIEVETDE